MGRDSVQIGVHMRKISVKSVKLFYRSVCKHPLLAGLLCFVLFLYKTSPFLLSLLVTASPVLVCTSVLLATLLSFGQPNIPEIEEEEEEAVTHEMASLKAAAAQDATVVERDVSFATERFVEGSLEQASSLEAEVGNVENVFDSSVDNVLLVDDKSRDDQYEKLGVDEDERLSEDLGEIHKDRSLKLETEGMASDAEENDYMYSLIGKGRDEHIDGEGIENQYTLIGQGRDEDHDGEETENWGRERDENLEVETDKLLGELVGSHTRRPVDSEEEEEDDDHSSDDESDGAESSSPDASLADIIPLLDELHPLLDEDAPLPAHMSHDDDSDAASERSDEDSEDKEDEEEEASPGEKGGAASTSPIIWTEDDQKNVMDLGTSEIERNQRLESLIARRKARKAITMMKHKDLIDFDSDLLFKGPHITTTRRNPFDGPDDSYGDLGLPPIPGSAPSIMLPRRNPFDIPYDSSEEKPDLKGDSFEEDFTGFHHKESTIFRRHESFSWGPSTLGGLRKERREISWRPFFVAESLASEGTSSPSLHRQLSEISDAKTSSVPDTGSVISAVDQDDLKLNDLSQERELMPHIDHASDHSDQESQSSDDADSVHIEEIVLRDINHDEVEIAMRDLQIRHPTAEAGDAATPMELIVGENDMKPEAAEDEHVSGSSRMLSEIGEVVSDVSREGTTELESTGIITEESVVPEHLSLEGSEFKHVTEVLDDDQQQKEPVYDSSPSPIEKLLSFSSISSEMASLPASEEATAQFKDKESEMRIENRAIDIHSNEVFCAVSSPIHQVDGNVPKSEEVVAVSDHDDGKDGSPEVENDSDNANELGQLASSNLDAEVHAMVNQNVDVTSTVEEEQIPSVVVEHVSAVHTSVSSSEVETAEEPALDEAETHNLVQDQRKNEDEFHLPNLDAEVDPDVHEQFDSKVVEQVLMVHQSSLDTDHAEDHMLDEEEAPKFVQKEVPSSSYHANDSDGLHPDLDVKVVSQSSYEDEPSKENCPTMKKQPTWSDKSMVEPSFDDHHELQEQSFVQTEIMDAEEGITDTVTVPPSLDSTHDSCKTSEHVSSISGEVLKNEEEDQVQASGLNNSSSVPYVALITEANIKMEEDDIKEIDEGLLSELDRVGDFCTEEVDESIHNEMILEGTAEFEPSDNEVNVSETNLELPAFEARSVEDIEMAFKQLHEGVDIEEVILPSSEETISNFMVINARSVDDIHVVLKGVSDSDLGKSPDALDSKDGLTEDKVSSTEEIDSDEVESTVEETSTSALIDARSVDDIDVVLKEVSDGNLGKSPEPLDSMNELAEVKVDEVSSTEDLDSAEVELKEATTMPLDEATDSSNFQVIDARSVDDIDVALKEVSDGNMGKLPEPLDSMNELAEVKVDEVSSTKDLDSAEVELKEASTMPLSKPVEGLDEASDNPNFQVSDGRAVEDSNEAAKEVSDGILEKSPEPLDSKDKLAEVEVDKVSSIEGLISARVEPDLLDETSDNSTFQVIDARSVDDIDVALKEISDTDLGKSPEPLESKDESAEVEVDKVSSTEDLDVARVEPSVEETSMVALDKPVDGIVEPSDSSSLKQKGEKGKSHQSSCSSNSSSSSSSSDSD